MPLSNRTCFLVNLRDRLSCKQCGLQPTQPEQYHRGFEYHHRLPRSTGGSDEPENIVLLCHTCHERWHQTPYPLSTDDWTPPNTFLCVHCGKTQTSSLVEMNCGWYRCDACHRQTSLFEHFFGPSASTRLGMGC